MRTTSLVSLGPIGPHAALVLLSEFYSRKLSLTPEDYDTLFDAVITFLEKVNDEKHRLQG